MLLARIETGAAYVLSVWVLLASDYDRYDGLSPEDIEQEQEMLALVEAEHAKAKLFTLVLILIVLGNIVVGVLAYLLIGWRSL